MASSVPGPVNLPHSKYDLSTYWGRVKHCAEISDPTMLLNTTSDIENAKRMVWDYKNGVTSKMTLNYGELRKYWIQLCIQIPGKQFSCHLECLLVFYPIL